VPASFCRSEELEHGLNYERARNLARWCMAQSGKMRREVVKRLRATFGQGVQ
jgi:hypothetical protein